ncbi:hypothetical protein ACS0TY_035283 [Phlomoides rotata]
MSRGAEQTSRTEGGSDNNSALAYGAGTWAAGVGEGVGRGEGGDGSASITVAQGGPLLGLINFLLQNVFDSPPKSSETSPTRLSSLSSETSPKSVRRSPSEGRLPKALRNRSPPKPLRNLPFRSHSPPKALTSHDGYFGVGVKLPTIEVRYADLRVAAECQVVYGKPLPTLWNSLKSLISDVRRLPCFPLQDTHVDIINDVSGIIKPGRVWENYTIEIFIRKLGQITQENCV